MAPLTWLVTGCSTGIGEEFVVQLLAQGERVIATARKASERLHHLKDLGASVIDIDITAPQAELNEKIHEAIGIYDGIDVLVNNAGVFAWGLIEELSEEDWLKMLNTNLFGNIKMTQALLPYFREKKGGKVVFMGSQNGWVAGAGSAAYSVSRFALEGFVESLQKETSQFGIQSIIFDLGPFRTGVLSSIQRSALADHPDYGEKATSIEAMLKTSDGNQRGDVQKGVTAMIDVLGSKGMAAGRVLPKRLPLNSDVLTAIRTKCLDTLKVCEEWEKIIISADVE